MSALALVHSFTPQQNVTLRLRHETGALKWEINQQAWQILLPLGRSAAIASILNHTTDDKSFIWAAGQVTSQLSQSEFSTKTNRQCLIFSSKMKCVMFIKMHTLPSPSSVSDKETEQVSYDGHTTSYKSHWKLQTCFSNSGSCTHNVVDIGTYKSKKPIFKNWFTKNL